MPIPVHDALVRAMSGTERSRVRTEFRLRLPEPINRRSLESRGRHCYAIKLNVASTPTSEPSSILRFDTNLLGWPPFRRKIAGFQILVVDETSKNLCESSRERWASLRLRDISAARQHNGFACSCARATDPASQRFQIVSGSGGEVVRNRSARARFASERRSSR
jgi:hypothetical protein